MRKPAKLAMPLVALVLLTGCVKDIVGIASCDVGNHVLIGKGDTLTDPTASEIEKNNRSREAAGCVKPQRVASKTP
jgi:hypothetical protein